MLMTFAVGHLALAYFAGKLFSKATGVEMNIPLVLAVSILPDVDLFLEPLLRHGGPTHSLFLLIIVFIPAILIWKKATIPYIAAAASHSLLGDYLTRSVNTTGVQLFFPLTSDWFSAGSEELGLTYVYSEMALFIIFLSLLFTTRDVKALVRNHPSNWLLGIPLFTLVLPVLTGIPTQVPIELFAPHLALIVLLTVPILVDVKHLIHAQSHIT